MSENTPLNPFNRDMTDYNSDGTLLINKYIFPDDFKLPGKYTPLDIHRKILCNKCQVSHLIRLAMVTNYICDNCQRKYKKRLYYRELYYKYKYKLFRFIKSITKYIFRNHENKEEKGSRDIDFLNSLKYLTLNKDKITDKQKYGF